MGVDDSIVRGNTARQLVEMARNSGAKKIYFASTAPPIRYPNVYGIDMPTKEELVAHEKECYHVAEDLKCDRVFYLKLSTLEESVRVFNTSIKTFDSSCFNGKYVTGDIDNEYFIKIASKRSD